MGRIVERLAQTLDLTYYSLIPTHPDFVPEGYRLRSPGPPSRTQRRAWRGSLWPGLLRHFFADHRRTPFDVLLSFWGHPMGALVAGAGRLVRRPSTAIFLGAELAAIPELDY
ncbi:MAG: hypothetical protein JOZ69_11750, partial [Myxococcales bacterium]|nr:hypothetical protein [Myxococcales bacterium]